MPSTPPPNAPPPAVPGLEFGEWIGAGGSGVVYRAVHLALQRTVAVKLTPAPAEDPASGSGWLREPRLMASLAHPHVVAVYDAGRAEGYGYLVMEHMPGGSLRTRMEPGRPWPLARAAAVLDQIAGAVEYIHGQGVLHLDLKPENVLYSADGQVKIADFGLSAPGPESPAGAGAYQGTLDYAAPERLTGAAPDPRFDVFSLATMAYELLTGRFPGRVYVPATRRNSELPAALDEVLRRGLARDPKERYVSIAQFRQALAGACRQPRRRSRGRWVVAAAGLMAVVVALVAVNRRRGTDPQPPEPPPRLWLLYDRPDDLALFAGDDGRELTSGTDVAVERVPVEDPRQGLPPELPLQVWPKPRPVLVVQSPGAWGFVHPLRDPTLGQRVVRNWPELLRTAVPPGDNLVKAGGFDGDCLATNDRGNLNLWRVDRNEQETPSRKITLTRPDEGPDNPALLLTNLDPARRKDLLGCYQPVIRPPPPGAVVVLRYRARADAGPAQLQVYLRLPVVISPDDAGAAATRIRALNTPTPPQPADPQRSLWSYRIPALVTPAEDWQTYLVVYDCPPFPTRATHRNLVVDVLGNGRVWVDDVELFVWQPGSEE